MKVSKIAETISHIKDPAERTVWIKEAQPTQIVLQPQMHGPLTNLTATGGTLCALTITE